MFVMDISNIYLQPYCKIKIIILSDTPDKSSDIRSISRILRAYAWILRQTSDLYARILRVYNYFSLLDTNTNARYEYEYINGYEYEY